MTFISTHYAITAAHCVDSADVPNPATTMLTVDQVDVSAASLPTIAASEATTSSMFASFPNYSFAQLTAAQGYKQTEFTQCHVVQRCAYGSYNCTQTGDEALLRCDDRPWGSSSVPVATSDAQTGPVTMEWFHEVYPSMPISAPTPPGRISSGIIWEAYDATLGRYDGYTLYPAIDPSAPVGGDQYLWSQNFHYYGGGRNQLLPLASAIYQEGDIFWDPTRLGYDSTAGVVWTDLWGCHGTSGSGVFQWVTTNGLSYTPQFVGAVVSGSNASGLGPYLCDTFTGLGGHGIAQMGYTPLSVSQYLATTAAGDWFHIPIHLDATAAAAPAAFPLVINTLYSGPPARGFTLGK